jgi:hypothetical protein
MRFFVRRAKILYGSIITEVAHSFMYGICQIGLMPEHKYRSTCAERPSDRTPRNKCAAQHFSERKIAFLFPRFSQALENKKSSLEFVKTYSTREDVEIILKGVKKYRFRAKRELSIESSSKPGPERSGRPFSGARVEFSIESCAVKRLDLLLYSASQHRQIQSRMLKIEHTYYH